MRIRTISPSFLPAAAALTLAGCASVLPGPGFEDVRGRVRERSGSDIQWRAGTPQDDAVDQAIAALLTRPLDADAAVQVALLRNPRLQATYEDLGIAQSDLVQAGLLKNPVFSGFARFAHGSPSGTNIELDLAQDFLGLIFVPARKRIAATQLEEKKLRVTHAVLDLAAAARRAYFELLAAQNLAAVLERSAAAAEASAAISERLHAAGNAAVLALAREQAAHQTLEIEVLRARGEALLAREELARQLGLAADGPGWTVPETLPEMPAADGDLGDLESVAVAARADLGAAREEVNALRQALGLQRVSRWFPLAEIGFDTERELDGTRVTGPSFALELPIFDQGQARRARLAGELRAADRRLEALAIDARAEVRSARARLELARTLAERMRERLLPLREQVVALSLREYDFMLASVFDVLADKQQEIEAYRGYVGAVRDYWLARSDLERALGERLPAASIPPGRSAGAAAAPKSPPASGSGSGPMQAHHGGHAP